MAVGLKFHSYPEGLDSTQRHTVWGSARVEYTNAPVQLRPPPSGGDPTPSMSLTVASVQRAAKKGNAARFLCTPMSRAVIRRTIVDALTKLRELNGTYFNQYCTSGTRPMSHVRLITCSCSKSQSASSSGSVR